MPIVPFEPLSYEDFPASEETCPGMRTLPLDRDAYGVELHPNVRYAQRDGLDLHLQIFVPAHLGQAPEARLPLVVYVQGSAWHKQEIYRYMPPLERIAARGYVVAIVEYRPSEVQPFPAQVQDTKTAIRFLRRHAADYSIDPERVVVMGDSSGGHTAVMTGLTAHRDILDTPLYGEQPCTVRGIVDYYGPSDVSQMCLRPSTMDHIGADCPEGMMIGGFDVLEHPEKVAPTVPMNYITPEPLPPVLILHGTKDRLVPFHQSILLYESLRASGQDATFYRIDGADHGGPAFWAKDTLDIVCAFIARCTA